MAFGNVADRGSPAMAEINIIPLCDVLLVLLIIFMVTAPALSQQIDLDLPQAGPPSIDPPSPVELRIASSGQVFWNGAETDRATLLARMQAEVRDSRGQQPMLQIDAAGDADYQAVVRVLTAAENAGMERVGFVRR
jgi:biopolymer transport protein ExbD